MTSLDFEQKCQSFDWFYEYQDSFENSGFNQGFEAKQKLLAEIEKRTELQKIYNKYNPFINLT